MTADEFCAACQKAADETAKDPQTKKRTRAASRRGRRRPARRRSPMRHGQYRFIAGFLVPPLVLYAVFVISPFIQAFHYSLTNWTGVSPQFDFVGLQNFQTLLHDSCSGARAEQRVLLVALPVLTILLALFFAFMLNVGGRGTGAGVRGCAALASTSSSSSSRRCCRSPIIAVLWAGHPRPDPDRPAQRRPAAASAWSSPGDGWATPTWRSGACWGSWSGAASASTWCCSTPPCSSIPKDIYEAALLDGAGRGGRRSSGSPCRCCGTRIQTAWVYLAIIALDFFALVRHDRRAGAGRPTHSQVMATCMMPQNGFQFGQVRLRLARWAW